MIILGIETSCDDTGVALYDSARGLLGHQLYSQLALHARYGGVVPELASRDHVRKLLPLVQVLLNESGLTARELGAIACTEGPGLAGALLVGTAFAHGLGHALGIPVIGVHHMEAHLLAPMLEPDAPDFPFLALLVSGGHTMLVDVAGLGRYHVLGESRDDAVGEAFDKAAKALGLGYPGGPAIARLAEAGNDRRFKLPRPMTDVPGLEFSFSGLKTALLTAQRASAAADPASSSAPDARCRADLAASFQRAAVETLVIKCVRALDQTGHSALVVAGGVGANRLLRTELGAACTRRGARLYFPSPAFCTDNGAMVAFAGYRRWVEAGMPAAAASARAFGVRPRWRLDESGSSFLASPQAGGASH